MSAPDKAADDLVNKGFIVKNPGAGTPCRSGRTFIVTGLHRSGTSLVAAILRQVGIFMGTDINDIVHEDEAIAKILIERDSDGLTRMIRERNKTYGTWGFKFPMLCQALGSGDIGRFTDPHLIVTFRDPVSVAVRTSLSEYQDPMQAFRTAATAQAELLTFLDQLQCPTLLLSYEKSLVFPGDFVDSILRFCDLPRSDALRDRLVRLIEPNRQTYIVQARRRYEGLIEGVSRGQLYGWCRLTGLADPVTLDLLVDELKVLAFQADVFRQDLLDAGFGEGRHAFYLDLAKLSLRPDSVIRIKVAGHGVELGNSGRRMETYGG